MPGETIEHWEQTQAELEIRRWLHKNGLWAPGAERWGADLANAPRRLSAEQIELLLRSEVLGRLGCHAEGKTYVVPVAYVYDGQSIYGHSGEGQKLDMLRANPEVCFEVEQIESLRSWRSVICWGRFEELHGDEAEQAARLLAERLRPLAAERDGAEAGTGYDAEEARRPVVYRIRLSERSGRYLTHA